jgi:hypothetical protein
MRWLTRVCLKPVGKPTRQVQPDPIPASGGLYALEGLPELQQAKER